MKYVLFLITFLYLGAVAGQKVEIIAPEKVWNISKAREWYQQQPWMTGANYVPSTVINQIEMWQSETFDTITIDKEFSWASKIGFNTMRVFLHSLVWEQGNNEYYRRIDRFLSIADRYGIRIMFVFFDDCWNKDPKKGRQPTALPGVHNSGWMQDPGQAASSNTKLFPKLEKYVKGVLIRFKKDQRILMWDLYNEPGNSEKEYASFPLVVAVTTWAKEVQPDQPITIGLWKWDLVEMNAFQAINSRVIEILKSHGKPFICTEYMARTRNNRFSNTMPMLKEMKIGAFNWGLVAGKSNIIYQWDTPVKDGGEPVEWFHDIFRPDGTHYRADEIRLITELNKKKTVSTTGGN